MSIAPASVDRITRASPPEEVAFALAQPAVERPEDEWWRWRNVVRGFQLGVDAFLSAARPFPGPTSERGIVIVGGGKYLPSVYVTVRVLRHVGCKLPIEVWHFENENDRRIEAAIRRYDVSFVNADAVRQRSPFRFLDWHWWKGWQLKSFALLNTSFREVLLLDADCYPNRNPEYLFDWDGYCDAGVVIWPDLANSPTTVTAEVRDVFQISPPSDRLAESGQMLVNRQRSWRQLLLAGYYNQCADITYRYIWGDKDTFPFAWRRTGKNYARMWPESHAHADCILQYDFNGLVIFQHRVSDKFKLEAATFASTAQLHEKNRYHRSLAHESFCFHALGELQLLLRQSAPNGHDRRSVPETARVASYWGSLDSHPSSAEPRSIQEMYPAIPVDLLVSQRRQREFREMFLESGELTGDPFEAETRTIRPQKKCIAVSMFKRSVDNRVADEFPVDEAHWREKYWNGLRRVVGELPAWPDWKLRVYVEPQLWTEATAEFASHPQVELWKMRSNSVGGSPGQMWRFLAFGDRSLELVLVTDIDESLLVKEDYVRSFEMDGQSALGRIGGFRSDRGFFVAPDKCSAKNYATILASRVIGRPSQFEFDIAAVMRGFMAHRRAMSSTDHPWAYSPTEGLNDFNRPIGAHVYGWGSHWYMYGFDERFLKHVLYYHFAEQGKLHTWSSDLRPTRVDPEGACDWKYVQAKDNRTLNPHSAVRLRSLDLNLEAKKIAFAIEEHRWIFDQLLEIIYSHRETGVCGNLFFHDINEPYFLELVPKQINLFHAARSSNRALEIGFNAGHSAALMLLANPKLTVRAFDTCTLAYTRPALEFLNSTFDNRITLIPGLSQATVPNDPTSDYDLLHIDGDHTYDAVKADLDNSLPKCNDGAVVVMDDCEPFNDIDRAVGECPNLAPTAQYTLHPGFPGSQHAIFRFRQHPTG